MFAQLYHLSQFKSIPLPFCALQTEVTSKIASMTDWDLLTWEPRTPQCQVELASHGKVRPPTATHGMSAVVIGPVWKLPKTSALEMGTIMDLGVTPLILMWCGSPATYLYAVSSLDFQVMQQIQGGILSFQSIKLKRNYKK